MTQTCDAMKAQNRNAISSQFWWRNAILMGHHDFLSIMNGFFWFQNRNAVCGRRNTICG